MSILDSIKKTIKYSQKHKGQLTKKQLFERLIGNKIYTKEEFSNVKFPISNKKNKYIKEKIKKAEELAKLLNKKFKNILFLGITGSVAAEYPGKNDDIDLMIIIQKNRLWLTRLKLRYFIYKNSIPHRRYGQKENGDDFCFNLWLDENNLLLPTNRQNLKNAIDMILIKPLINKNKTYERFINVNNWAIKYVATGYTKKMSDVRCQMSDNKISDVRSNILDKIVNWMVFWPQYWYMKKRIKNEEIGLHKAFFHH